MQLHNVSKRGARQSPCSHLAGRSDRARIVGQAGSSLLTTVQRMQRGLASTGCSQDRGAAFNQIKMFRRLPRCTKHLAGRTLHALHGSHQPRQCQPTKARYERIARQYLHRN